MDQQQKIKIAAIIPSRYDSVRFPGKPLAKVGGKSLVQRTYENAKRSSMIDYLIVATDDQRIFDHVKEFGGNVIMTSSSHLTGSDRLVEVLEKEDKVQNAEMILNIQGDEPLIEPEVLESVINALQSDKECVVSTAVIPLHSEELAIDRSIVKCVFDQNHRAIYFSRALIPHGKNGKLQEDTAYYHHLGIYCFRPQFLITYASLEPTPLQKAECLEQLKIIENGYKIKVAVVESESIGIDTPEDLKKVEQMLWKQNTSS